MYHLPKVQIISIAQVVKDFEQEVVEAAERYLQGGSGKIYAPSIVPDSDLKYFWDMVSNEIQHSDWHLKTAANASDPRRERIICPLGCHIRPPDRGA